MLINFIQTNSPFGRDRALAADRTSRRSGRAIAVCDSDCGGRTSDSELRRQKSGGEPLETN